MRQFVQGFLMIILIAGNFLPLRAQSWQVGAQQGISYWLTRKTLGTDRLRTLPGQHLTWDKELTLKYQTKKKLGFELGIGTYHFTQQTPAAQQDSILSIDGDTHALSLRMAVVYDVTYPLLQYMFPRMAAMKSYISFTCTPTMLWDDAIVAPVADESYHLSRNRFALWIGFGYTHEIPLAKKLLLINQFSFSGHPFIKYRNNEDVLPLPNKRMSIQSGLRFKL